MKVLAYSNNIDEYLEATNVVDYDNDTIQKFWRQDMESALQKHIYWQRCYDTKEFQQDFVIRN